MTPVIEALNRIQSPFNCHVVIYHATYPTVPPELIDGLHNVTPHDFRKQIEWYGRHYDIVSIDNLFKHGDPSGKVCITFDDAYQSVFDYALPILIEMGIPATVFLIGSSLSGKVFWRDKIRFLINSGLASEFIQFCQKRNQNFIIHDLYTDSKSTQINSRLIDHELDLFLRHKDVINENVQLPNYCIKSPNDLIHHPLISYGNHTFNHYVMPSLTQEEQFIEINKTEELLDSLGLNRSRVFSVPFGGIRYADATTFNLLRKFNFRGILMSGNQVHWGRIKQKANTLPMVWRYMAPTDIVTFQKQLLLNTVAPFRKRLAQAHGNLMN